MNSQSSADVLVVDDNDGDADLCMHVLCTECPYISVMRVKDGEQALDYLFRRGLFAYRPSRQPRLVLLDLDTPRIGGLQVLEKIREQADTRDIPVIIMTVSSNPLAVECSYELGADSYVVKPTDLHQYQAQVAGIARDWLTSVARHSNRFRAVDWRGADAGAARPSA